MEGRYNYSAKQMRKELKNKGVFYTDAKLAEMLKNMLPDDVQEVYEPTCGSGNLLAVFPDEVAKYGQELNAQQLRVSEERLTNFQGVAGDTLVSPGFKGRKFKYIVANPPFSIKWSPPQEEDERFKDAPCLPPPSKADYAFILHILHYLANNGKAIVLAFPGVLYRGHREGKIRQWIVEQNWIEKVIHIPSGFFEDTNITTCCLVFNKAKKDTNIIFEDKEHSKGRNVTFEEVRANNFNLSVSTYVEVEVKKERIDPIAVELEAQAGLLQDLRKSLNFSKWVCEFEKMDFSKLLDEVQAIIDDFRAVLKKS